MFMLLCRNFSREFTLLFLLEMTKLEPVHSSSSSSSSSSTTTTLDKSTNKGEKPTSTSTSTSTSTLPQSLRLDATQDVCLNQLMQVSDEVRLPVFSTSRGKPVIRIHAMLRLLVGFFCPRLAAHLDTVQPEWWRPYSYPLEQQDDFVTVGSVP